MNGDSSLSNAFTAEEKDYLKEKGSLTVVLPRTSYGAVGNLGEKGNYTCLDADIAEYFCEKIGVSVDYVVADNTEDAVQMVKEQKADFLPVMTALPGTEDTYDDLQLFSCHLIFSELVEA